MPPTGKQQSYADSLNGILTAVTSAMAAPDADLRALLPLQMQVLSIIKSGPMQRTQQAAGGPGGPGGMQGPGAPAMAGAQQGNPQQLSPQAPRGMMAQPGMGGPGGMQANPDELRRMIQSQVGP